MYPAIISSAVFSPSSRAADADDIFTHLVGVEAGVLFAETSRRETGGAGDCCAGDEDHHASAKFGDGVDCREAGRVRAVDCGNNHHAEYVEEAEQRHGERPGSFRGLRAL